MREKMTSTRRTFLKGSAFVAAPFAVGAPAAALADDELKARAARLEDEAAIRGLHQDFLRQVNLAGRHDKLEGAVRAIAADHAGETEVIEISADGKRATGRFASIVEIETDLPNDNTLAQMAHAQGSGSVRQTERRVLTTAYVKTRDGWTIRKADFA
jgi:hypothetical protein